MGGISVDEGFGALGALRPAPVASCGVPDPLAAPSFLVGAAREGQERPPGSGAVPVRPAATVMLVRDAFTWRCPG